MHPPKPCLQRLQQFDAEPFPSFDRQIEIIGNVNKAMANCGFRVEKLAQEEVFGKSDAADSI